MLQNIKMYVNIYINKIKTNEKNISHYVKLTDHLWFKTRFQKSGLTCIICGTKHTPLEAQWPWLFPTILKIYTTFI